MTARKPLGVVIAGPDRAGKTTTAPDLFEGALAVTSLVTADRPGATAFAAGRKASRIENGCDNAWRHARGRSDDEAHAHGSERRRHDGA
jgi:hypothetical protein